MFYDSQEVGMHRLDLVVDERLVVELKAVRSFMTVHFDVVRSYMKAIDLDSGLLLSFGTMPLGIRKVFPSRPNRFPS